jgi:hypothetical protein
VIFGLSYDVSINTQIPYGVAWTGIQEQLCGNGAMRVAKLGLSWLWSDPDTEAPTLKGVGQGMWRD